MECGRGPWTREAVLESLEWGVLALLLLAVRRGRSTSPANARRIWWLQFV